MVGATAWTFWRTPSTMQRTSLWLKPSRKRAVGLPKSTPATVFEVVTEGKLYRFRGAALQRWTVETAELEPAQGLPVSGNAQALNSPAACPARARECNTALHDG